MSYYKEQLKNHLGAMDLKAGAVLSIGAQHDDRKYFKHVDVKEWKTLDCEEQFKPDILFNMNREFSLEEGDANVDDSLMEHFDAVLAFELWEYIYDPLTAHKNIYSFLKPGGFYWGSYPFVYPHHNPVGMDFLRYTDWGIKKLLTMAGFRDIEITPRLATAGRAELMKFVSNEGMRLSRDLPEPYNWPIGYIVKAKK